MKLNPVVRKPSGLTLIEVTLVIAVLLGLISVLFIGVNAYKKGSDRAKCIVNMSTVQKAVRSHQNLYEKNFGDPLTLADIAGPGLYIETYPTCPAGGTYSSAGEQIPISGIRYLYCTVAGHEPSNTDGW